MCRLPLGQSKGHRTSRPPLSPARHLLLGMEVGDRLVYGHTHRPSVSPDGLVANPGSWVHDGAALSYLRIEDDEVALRVFGRDPFP